MSFPASDEVPNPWFSWTYVQDNLDVLLAAGREHVFITVASMVLAISLAIPLAIIMRHWHRSEGPILTVSGLLYTIPSLAMIAALWPVFGLSETTVIVALSLYALLIVLRNIMVGLQAVPPDTVDAARGMGMRSRSMLWRVEVPLALPAILAGVRLATVSTVGLVTIGSLVGHGGFGTLILSGFVSNFYHAEIMTATIACVLLALIFEFALTVLERWLTPWSQSNAVKV